MLQYGRGDLPSELKKKLHQGYFSLRKYFYNEAELHDHDILSQIDSHEKRKTAFARMFAKALTAEKA